MVRVYMIFSGSGPILVATKLSNGMQGAEAKEYLANKGITKYIAYEVSASLVAKRYGHRFQAVTSQLTSDKDIRVMDIDGSHVFNNFNFTDMGEPVYVGGGAD